LSTSTCGNTLTVELPDLSATQGARQERLLNLLETAEQVGQIGSWEWLPAEDIRVWSDNLYRLLGLEPGEIPPAREFFIEQTHADDRERLASFMESSRWLRTPPPIELRVQHRTRGVRRFRATIAKVEWDGRRATRIVGVVQDVTDEELTRRQIAAHLAASTRLAEWDTLDDAAVNLLSEIGRAVDFVFGVLWLPRNRSLLPVAVWREPDLELRDLEAATVALRCALGSALPGRVWHSKRPETIADNSHNGADLRQPIAARAGMRGAVAFPALHLDNVIAVLEFYHRHSSEQIERLRPTMVALGHELGEFFSHRRGQLGTVQLTARQLDVLELAAAGNTTAEIAAALGLSSSTVRTHFDHLYEKLGVAERAAAVAQGVRLGLIA
jgi:DNA-binding CsgD family transcriptional regulator